MERQPLIAKYRLYDFLVYETGDRDPLPSWDTSVRSRDPEKLAKRYLRFLNYAWSKPGGVDQIVRKIEVLRSDNNEHVATVTARRRA